MQLEQLEAIVAVIDHGSVLAAARALGRRRATLLAQLDALEAELGSPLLVRGAHGSEPTRAGRLFADRARRILLDTAALGRMLDEGLAQRRAGISLPVGVHPGYLVVAARVLLARLSDMQFRFSVLAPEAALCDPEIDLVFQFGDALPTGPHRTFVVARVPVRLLASKAYLDAHGRPETVADLAAHRLLAWRGSDAPYHEAWPLLDGESFPVAPSFVSNDTHLLRVMTIAGVGIGLLLDSADARGTLPGEDLEPVLEGTVGAEAVLRVIIPERSAHSPATRAMIQLARELGLGMVEVPHL